MPIIDITNRCNLRCVYCCRGDMEGKRSIELSVEDILQCIYQFIEIHGRFIVLQGGEPLLHKDISELLNRIVELRSEAPSKYLEEIKGLVRQKLSGTQFKAGYRKALAHSGFPLIYISSNGMIYRTDIHEALKKSGCILEVSLDSTDSEINRATRVGADIDIIKENIRKYSSDIPVSIACTITEANVKYLDDMVTLACELNCISLKLSPVVAIGKRKDSFIKFIEDYHRSLERVLTRHRKEGYHIFLDVKTFASFDQIKNADDIYENLKQQPNTLIDRHYCDAIKSPNNIYVDPEMNVYGCASMKNLTKFCLGNLRKDNLKHILTKQNTLALIDKLIPFTQMEGCTAENICREKGIGNDCKHHNAYV